MLGPDELIAATDEVGNGNRRAKQRPLPTCYSLDSPKVLETLKPATDSIPLQHRYHTVEVFQGRIINRDPSFALPVPDSHLHSEQGFERPLLCAHIWIHPPRPTPAARAPPVPPPPPPPPRPPARARGPGR